MHLEGEQTRNNESGERNDIQRNLWEICLLYERTYEWGKGQAHGLAVVLSTREPMPLTCLKNGEKRCKKGHE